MMSAVAKLSTTATTFDCHLLQRQSVHRPLDVLGTADQQERLRATVADRAANVLVVTPHGTVPPEFPEWMNVSVRTEMDFRVAAVLSSQTGLAPDENALEWFHLELPEGEDRCRWIAESLEAAAAIQFECQRQTLIVTAIGGEVADHGRFESLLWEGDIRLPLWIRDRDTGCGRVSRPTGSFDVLETILSCLEARETASTDQAVDLQLMFGELSESQPRSIRITGEGYEAVRTLDFLFVRSHSVEFGEKTALYAKPQDVWNVHDLSHEFPHVVDELLLQLPAVPSAGD